MFGRARRGLALGSNQEDRLVRMKKRIAELPISPLGNGDAAGRGVLDRSRGRSRGVVVVSEIVAMRVCRGKQRRHGRPGPNQGRRRRPASEARRVSPLEDEPEQIDGPEGGNQRRVSTDSQM